MSKWPDERRSVEVDMEDGAGLGVSIAQGFVDAMHGTVTLDDTSDGGLTVTIARPRAAEATA